MSLRDSVSVDVRFGVWYTASTLIFIVGLAVVVAQASNFKVELLGATAHSVPLLVLLLALEVIKVGVAKGISGHTLSLSLWWPGQAPAPEAQKLNNKSSFLRRTVQRFRRFYLRVKTPTAKIGASLLVIVLAWLTSAYVAVLFGAPVFSRHSETLSFAALVTILVVVPTVLILGPDQTTLSRVFLEPASEDDPLSEALFSLAVGGAVGAWAGAFPIPLDWDRPWQTWPISCCIGAVGGNAIGAIYALLKLKASGRSTEMFARQKKRT